LPALFEMAVYGTLVAWLVAVTVTPGAAAPL
jgi:hypothetical protein